MVARGSITMEGRTSLVNWDQIEGKWKQFRGRAREKWGKLTDDDLDVVQGKRDRLAGVLQEKYGIAKGEADKQLRDFERSLDRA
jgi:uncharacterized protein YjbJ (UPF0337 family)